jgi:TIR domain
MALYGSTYLKQQSNNKTQNERIKMFSQRDIKHTSFDIFLSHSFLDKDEVEGLYLELTRMGFTVYVDWIIDPNLDRDNVTKESATIVRNRLRSSKTLLFAISASASVSKWIPWELGYVDGHTQQCAIIPVSREDNSPNIYKGKEYLSLYPFISKEFSSKQIEKLWVNESVSSYITLEQWFKGEMPYERR